jgi:hypothetical protein
MLRTKDQSAFGKDFTNSLGLAFMTIDNNGRRDAAEQWPNPFKKSLNLSAQRSKRMANATS